MRIEPLKPKAYIDGKGGTTGLQISDRLAARADIELLLIDEVKRKRPDERKKFLRRKRPGVFVPAGRRCPGGSKHGGESGDHIISTPAHRTAQRLDLRLSGLSQLHRALICRKQAGPATQLSRHRLHLSIYCPCRPWGCSQGDTPDLLLPHRLLRRRQKMIAEYEGEKGGAVQPPDLWAEPPPQAPAGDAASLRPDPPAGVQPGCRRLLQGHGHHDLPPTTTCSPAARARRRFGRRWRITTETRLSSMWRPWARRRPQCRQHLGRPGHADAGGVREPETHDRHRPL